MTQPPYHPPEGHPMRRFAVFSAALLILVVIGSLPWKSHALNRSMCVCLPTRASLILRSMTNVSVIKVKQVASKH
ncbi:MAG TPA: hypothetical protein VMB19_02585 [Silvibacterium sp.]|nr:hypothetical protein [Silvibacterium sp.]